MDREEQVARNLELAGRFLDHHIEHPSEAEHLDGATVVLIPDDDAELADANVELAKRLVLGAPVDRATDVMASISLRRVAS